MILEDYLSLFPGNTREKPRLMAVASAVLAQVMDLQDVIPEILQAYSLDNAAGATLDQIAASLGLSRHDTTVGAGASDATFRKYIRDKLILWSWDGTNKSAGEISDKISAHSFVRDNQNGSVTVQNAGSIPAEDKKIFPIPGGVRTT